MAKKIYVGVEADVPIYDTQNVSITASNISTYFTVTNGSYYFKGGGGTFTTNNQNVNNSTAKTTLTAKKDIHSITFEYAYSTEVNYDKFTLTVAGVTVENGVSGDKTGKWSGSLKSGDAIVFQYVKDSSSQNGGDQCTFFNMKIVLQTQTGTEKKSFATEVKKAFIGVDNFEPRELPAGYTQVEYIESSGTQYIDTGFMPNQDTRVVVDIKILDSQTTEGHICSVVDSSFYTLFFDPTQPGWYGSRYANGGVRTFPSNFNNRNRVLIEKDKNITKIGNVSITETKSAFQSTRNLPIFCRNANGTLNAHLKAKLYSCKIYDNGALIRDFVPCRNSSGVVGLYDLVGKRFYQNAGTGTFIAGSVHGSMARKVRKAYIGIDIFEQPKLTTNGTLGELNFAVSASNTFSAEYDAFRAFSGNIADAYSSNVNPSKQTIYLSFYNPTAIKVSTLKFTNCPASLTSSSPKNFSVQGSNDNNTWTSIGSFTNTNNTSGATWSINLTGGFYKYHRLAITSANTTENYVNIAEIAIIGVLEKSVAKLCFGGGGGELQYYGVLSGALGAKRTRIGAASNSKYAVFSGGANYNTPSEYLDFVPNVTGFDKTLTRNMAGTMPGQAYSLIGATAGDYAAFSMGRGSYGNPHARTYAFDSALTSISRDCGYAQVDGAATSLNGHALFAGGVGAGVVSNNAYGYNPSMTSISLPAIHAAQRLAAAANGEFAIFAGGFERDGAEYANASAFNKSFTRMSCPALSLQRRDLEGAVAGGTILFAGGVSYNYNNSAPLTTVDAYSPSLTKVSVSALPAGRTTLVGTSLGGHAIFAEGTTDKWQFAADAAIYDESLTQRKVSLSGMENTTTTTAATIGDYAIFAGLPDIVYIEEKVFAFKLA